MKLKASYFSISKPLILENLRRFWALPALAFLVYFLSGVFPVLMSYNRLNNMASYIDMSLKNQQPFYMFAHLIFPIVAAVVIFRYLQGISSVSVMHSMPFTRTKLYNSGFISGLILIVSPILVNGLILLAISKPVYRMYGTESGMMINEVNVFARADILNWIWVSILIAVVIYAVSVFAGIVTGNALMHFATAIWFNFLIPALYAVFIAYFSQFLYGFDTAGNWVEFGMKISPYLSVLQNQGHLGLFSTIYYLISAIVLFIITGFLYRKRNLEHATDSLAFSFMEPIICYLIAFLGMTLLGFYFQVLGKSEFYMYGGLAAGTLIFFIIGQMIVKKTPRVYNLKSLKSLGIYALIAIVFILGLRFDLTGFEKRVPNPSKVGSMTFSDDFMRNYNNYYYSSSGYTLFKGDEKGLLFKDPANIEAAVNLHKMLVADKERLQKPEDVYAGSLALSYNPDSLFPLSRRYTLDYVTFGKSPDFKQIYESKEYKDYFAPSNLNYEKLDSILVSTDKPNVEAVEIKRAADLEEFMKCLDLDFKAQKFEDRVDLKHGYATASINFMYKDTSSNTPERLLNNNIAFKITESYTNTIQWLESKGYGERFKDNTADIEYIEIYHYVQSEDQDDNRYPAAAEYSYSGNGVMGIVGTSKTGSVEIPTMKITDPDQIKQILESYETSNIVYSDYYYGTIFYKGSVLNQQNYGSSYAKEMAEKYGADYSTSESGYPMVNIYFNEGNIPDFVLDYFQ
ncbi:acyltransferase [Anoxybacterium hadale]|uniref:Acyltransferase n=1 Tax=Anoxybacterium hadale TaxID=3408580 RepID=A0ACD1A820_9FIRM|nr:acyltransferase [Clostridiales bacterium]